MPFGKKRKFRNKNTQIKEHDRFITINIYYNLSTSLLTHSYIKFSLSLTKFTLF